MVTGLVGGLLADVILKKANYKSAKSTVLSKDFPITYKAYNGETAVIDGGITLSSEDFKSPA